MKAGVAVLFAYCGCALAQTQSPPPAGVEMPWDAQKLLAKVVASNTALESLLTALDPQAWYDQKGAASTYILQKQSAQQQLRYVETASGQLSKHVDSLSGALDLYYRMEALESTARSLSEGAQRYADRGPAEKLAQWVGQAFDARRRWRDYIQDLATSLEQNFKIADEEAQRCRGTISNSPAPSARKSTTK